MKPAPIGAAARATTSPSGCFHTSAETLPAATTRYANSAIQAAGTWTYMMRTVSPC